MSYFQMETAHFDLLIVFRLKFVTISTKYNTYLWNQKTGEYLPNTMHPTKS
jgi:hypothetical protein